MSAKNEATEGYVIINAPAPTHKSYWTGGAGGSWSEDLAEAHAYTTRQAAQEAVANQRLVQFSVGIVPVLVEEGKEGEAPTITIVN